MASPPDNTDQYDFVKQPSEDFFCPVTFELLLDAHQTVCCKGNHLSEKAVERNQREGKPCPICRQELKTMPDYYFQRKVRELKVRCPNKSLGCQWVGELGNLEDHLKERSVVGDCQYVEVACPNSCGGRVQRRQLATHKSNICPKRPFACQYCAYGATYQEITEEHWAICKRYPLQCPNKCGENAIERQDLECHLDERCPLMVIECEFGFAGCEEEMERKLMQTHLDENVTIHLSMLREKFEEQEEIKGRQMKELQTQLQTQQRDREYLQKMVETLFQTLSALSHSKPLPPAFIPPPVITMTDFEKHKRDGDKWCSPPFYSHIGGYKMCIGVSANGFADGKGTHVSVGVHMMQGEYDDYLHWPFRGDITVQLLNQRRDGGHVMTFPFDDRVPDEQSGRVVGQERTQLGWGFDKFIAHTDLGYNAVRNTEYLNDCLKFRVTNVVVKSTK